MTVLHIILIVLSVVFFVAILATKSGKSTYHPHIRGPRGRLPGRDDHIPPKGGTKKTPPPKSS